MAEIRQKSELSNLISWSSFDIQHEQEYMLI